jgi:hypothetical protein
VPLSAKRAEIPPGPTHKGTESSSRILLFVSFPNKQGGRICWEDGSANELLAKELSTSGASGMERYRAVRKVKVRCYGIERQWRT